MGRKTAAGAMVAHIVLNEQQLPEPYESEREAREEAKRLALELEALGKPARWFISAEPKAH